MGTCCAVASEARWWKRQAKDGERAEDSVWLNDEHGWGRARFCKACRGCDHTSERDALHAFMCLLTIVSPPRQTAPGTATWRRRRRRGGWQVRDLWERELCWVTTGCRCSVSALRFGAPPHHGKRCYCKYRFIIITQDFHWQFCGRSYTCLHYIYNLFEMACVKLQTLLP